LTDLFPIYQIEPNDRSGANTRNDSEGRFYKYWCNLPQLGRCLFKAAAPDGFTPEQLRLDGNEKVAAKLGQLLGLPVAQTELAVGYALELDTYLPGTLSIDYTPSGAQILSGREFMSIVDPLYDVERLDGLDAYNVENVLKCLEENSVGLPPSWQPLPGIETAADVMVGYLLFDAWISATDRHDENWELALLEDGYLLCPTFDHGDSLGVKLSAEFGSIVDRAVSLENRFRDPKLIESCWWQNLTIDGRVKAVEISNIKAFTIAAQLRPVAARIWLQQLNSIDLDDIDRVFDRVPSERITNKKKLFAIDLLLFNHQQLTSAEMLNKFSNDRISTIDSSDDLGVS
jgi:hypothetical protein